MRVAAILHVHYVGLGSIAPALSRFGHEVEYFELFHKDPLPLADDFDAFAFMGGTMSANDPLPYLDDEARLIRDLAEAGKPVVGVCLGAQLIAKAQGARVYASPQKEIGWYTVDWTGEARHDRLFCSLSQPEVLFQWHSEMFDLPPGAVWLASSEVCRNQAFRIGDSMYGLQFHMEATPEMIVAWLREDADCGDARQVTEPIDPYAHSARQLELAENVFGDWARLIGAEQQH